MQAIRTATAAVILLCAAAPNSNARSTAHAQSTAVAPMTTIVGVIRSANVGRPLKNAIIHTNDSTTVARTDSAGRFVLQTSRQSSLLAVSKEEYREFQFPLLELTTDTLFVDIELRTDPPMLLQVGNRPGYVPTLCIAMESPKELAVTNTCNLTLNAPEGYTQKGYKHHLPRRAESVYFGPAGDDGGIIVRKRVPAPR